MTESVKRMKVYNHRKFRTGLSEIMSKHMDYLGADSSLMGKLDIWFVDREELVNLNIVLGFLQRYGKVQWIQRHP